MTCLQQPTCAQSSASSNSSRVLDAPMFVYSNRCPTTAKWARCFRVMCAAAIAACVCMQGCCDEGAAVTTRCLATCAQQQASASNIHKAATHASLQVSITRVWQVASQKNGVKHSSCRVHQPPTGPAQQHDGCSALVFPATPNSTVLQPSFRCRLPAPHMHLTGPLWTTPPLPSCQQAAPAPLPLPGERQAPTAQQLP